MNCAQIIIKLKSYQNPKNIAGMVRFGISSKNTLGVSIPVLRHLAKDIKKDISRGSDTIQPPRLNRRLNRFATSGKKQKTPLNSSKILYGLHKLAQELWDCGIHEARILAAMIDVPLLVTRKQMDKWTADFDSWDVCDQVCSNLFDKTRFAYEKAIQWSSGKSASARYRTASGSGKTSEFVKRAGFAMMAVLVVHDKKADDKKILQFFPIIKRESTDERNYVRKAVNWALRQIGKRNSQLKIKAIKLAEEIATIDSKSARWIAKDALRELRKKL